LDFGAGERSVGKDERIFGIVGIWLWRMLLQKCKSQAFATDIIFE
jgi:hypothetical protein